jgi:hypothetical protein
MREMKPLMLPKLVAERKSSKSSLDMFCVLLHRLWLLFGIRVLDASHTKLLPWPSQIPQLQFLAVVKSADLRSSRHA